MAYGAIPKRSLLIFFFDLTGHSLGAAMARVTQYFLISTNQFPDAIYEIYTYGEPRNGNKYYADYLNNLNVKTVRVTNR